MNQDHALRRAQIYRFLADAFLYPRDDWTLDAPLLHDILRELNAPPFVMPFGALGMGLDALQSEHRHALGITGSMCYETEYGLPHEFRQSQELADIAGFYGAFGFQIGGTVRERPDHLAAELEFLSALALKEAYAHTQGVMEHVEICEDATRKFLTAHTGHWIGLLLERLAQNHTEGIYFALAQFTTAFVQWDAERLGVELAPRALTLVAPTPEGPDLSCDACPAVELNY